MKTTGGQLAYRRRRGLHSASRSQSLGHERVEINRDAPFELTSRATDYIVSPILSDVRFLTFEGTFDGTTSRW